MRTAISLGIAALLVLALGASLALANTVWEPSPATQLNYSVAQDGLIELSTPIEPGHKAIVEFIDLPAHCWDSTAFNQGGWGRLQFGKNYYGRPVCVVEPSRRWY